MRRVGSHGRYNREVPCTEFLSPSSTSAVITDSAGSDYLMGPDHLRAVRVTGWEVRPA